MALCGCLPSLDTCAGVPHSVVDLLARWWTEVVLTHSCSPRHKVRVQAVPEKGQQKRAMAILEEARLQLRGLPANMSLWKGPRELSRAHSWSGQGRTLASHLY